MRSLYSKKFGLLITLCILLITGCRQVWTAQEATDQDAADNDKDTTTDVPNSDTKSLKIAGDHYILLGNSIDLTATYEQGSETPTITSWTSNGENKADASTANNGTVLGKALGKDIIITATSDQGKTATHRVTVYQVILEYTDGSGAVAPGDNIEEKESLTLIPKIEPSGVNSSDVDLSYTWKPDTGSGGSAIIIENADGSITITGVSEGAGSLVITDGANNTHEIPFHVVPEGARVITISGLTLVDANLARAGYESKVGGIYGQYAHSPLTVSSAGAATIDVGGAVWSSEDESIATISGSGDTATVMGVKEGTVHITVQAKGKQTTFPVEVVESTFMTFDLSGVTAEGDGTYRLELPLVADGSASWQYEVDWGDESEVALVKATDGYDSSTRKYPVHYYPTNGVYTVKLLKRDDPYGMQDWNFGAVTENGGRSSDDHSADELIDIMRFGSGKIGTKTFQLAGGPTESGTFVYCINLTGFSADKSPNLGDNLTNMFYYASSFDVDVSDWDVSHVISMVGMFSFSSFNHDISGWDIGSVQDMQAMFHSSSFYNNGVSLHVDDGAHESWDFDARAAVWPSTKPNVSNMFSGSPMEHAANAHLKPKGL